MGMDDVSRYGMLWTASHICKEKSDVHGKTNFLVGRVMYVFMHNDKSFLLQPMFLRGLHTSLSI